MAQPETNAHLERAKQFLAIAESGDAKREAYKHAAEEIAAYQTETGEDLKRIAMRLEWKLDSRGRSQTIEKLMRWRKTEYEAQTPFLMDEQATSRAAHSHAKTVLREAPIEEVERIVADLPPERRQAVAKAIEDTHPANRSKPPLGVPKADVTFLTRMAGPINRLRHAVDGFVVDYEAHVEDAHEDDVELVREEVAPLLAKVSALTTDWSVR